MMEADEDQNKGHMHFHALHPGLLRKEAEGGSRATDISIS
jgi:hypothetical protein